MDILKKIWKKFVGFFTEAKKVDTEKQEALSKLYTKVKEASDDGIITADEMSDILKLKKELNINDSELTNIKIKVVEHIMETIARDSVVEEEEMRLLQTIQSGLAFEEQDLGNIQSELARIREMYLENKKLVEEQSSPIHRNWWERLDEQWKDIFKDSIFIDEEPNDEELIEIVYQKEMVLSDLDVEDLSPLEHLPHLSFLSLANNAYLSDLQGVRSLKNLKHLDCSQTYITDLTPLKSLEHLEVLNISNCTLVKDFSTIQRLKNLRILRANNISLSNLQIIKESVDLEELQFNETAIFSLKPLENLQAIEVLHLKNCVSIESLQGLENLLSLKELDISGTSVSNLESIAHLKELEYLNLSNTKVKSLRSVGRLENLQELHFASTEVDDLKALLPLEKLHTVDLKDCQNITDLAGLDLKENINLQFGNSGIVNKNVSKEIRA